LNPRPFRNLLKFHLGVRFFYARNNSVVRAG
jgi:hypothetical protein